MPRPTGIRRIRHELRNGNHWGTYRNTKEMRPWFAIGPVVSNGLVGVDVCINGRGVWLAPWWWYKDGRGIKAWRGRYLTRGRTIN